MKHICRNCQFLAKDYREENTGRLLSFSVSMDEREKARKEDVNFVKELLLLEVSYGSLG